MTREPNRSVPIRTLQEVATILGEKEKKPMTWQNVYLGEKRALRKLREALAEDEDILEYFGELKT